MPALEHGGLDRPRQERLEGVGDERQVLDQDLPLQGERRRRDDDAFVLVDGAQDGRHQVGERLAGTGARLDQQRETTIERLRDGACHGVLALAAGATERGNDGVEGSVDRSPGCVVRCDLG